MKQPQPFNVSDLKHHRGADFKQVYTNSATMGLSFFDVSITFGEIVPAGDVNTAPQIEDRVSVTMSWEHLKALGDAISGVLGNYEQSQGAIRTPAQQGPPVTFKA